MLGPSFGLSTLDHELLTLAIPALISSLECSLTKNAPASPLDSALTKSLDLKSFVIHSYKKHPGGPPLFFFLYFLYVLYLLNVGRATYWAEGVGRFARAR